MTPAPVDVILKTNTFEFVTAYSQPQFYYAKCFPLLFPFGRGCPSDANSLLRDIKKHSQKMLKRGGGPQGRRFQQTSSYYFTVYSYIIKQKIGGVAFRSQRSHLDGNAQPENIPTVGEVNKLLQYLGTPTEIHTKSAQSQCSTPHDTKALQKLISRLVPYSKNISGTEMGIRYEKRDLLALIPSPVINADGFWRFFITFAPADVYDSLLYEILCKTDNENWTWSERRLKVSTVCTVYLTNWSIIFILN